LEEEKILKFLPCAKNYLSTIEHANDTQDRVCSQKLVGKHRGAGLILEPEGTWGSMKQGYRKHS
jgi:hypothetical protein